VDLKAQYLSIKSDIDGAIQSVIDDTAFIKGKYVERFEEEYAERYDVRHCVGLASGTDAIYVSLKALGVGEGDEVITVANSWISTSETITQAGAKPVFVDIDADHYTIDSALIEKKITSKTKAIIPVHLFGQPADMRKIKHICDRHNLHLIEDCAQAHFAEYSGQKVGTFGVAGTFSFFPGKNLGAYGDAGAIVSNDDGFAVKARMYANHGALIKHKHEIEGINSRLDGMQAAILSVKLRHIAEWNRRRLQHANMYSELLGGVSGIAVPQVREDAKHVFHLYVIRVPNRDALQKHLAEKGISTGVHYPTPLPLLPAYKYLNCQPSDFPIASGYMDQILSLPMFPELTREMIEYVVSEVKLFLNS
jgi:dTDP-4-amino-4,6-dideoxygalactose transaminase